jgi:hypothetical protein
VLFRGIFLVALATLLFEITLIRVLSFTIWYHFAYVVISSALLGFGASGTLLAVRPSIGARDLRAALARCSALAALAAGAFLVLVWGLPLHPMEVLEQPGQGALLLAYQLGATVPFFFSGLVVSLSMREAALRVDRLYFWDLLGAGAGCALAVTFMNVLSPPGAALVAAALFALASFVYARGKGGRVVAAALGAPLLVAAAFGPSIPFTPARSKEIARLLDENGMAPSFSRWTALFRTDVVRAKPGSSFPDSIRWGLSPTAPEDFQRPCCYVTHDGTAGTPIFDMGEGELDFLDHHILRLPYLITEPEPHVLIIGVGGGRDILTALRYGASRVTGVELDPVTVELIESRLDDVSHGYFRRPEVELFAAEGRHFVRSSEHRFDLIQITGVDTLSAEFSGAYILAENYIYTVEALHDYLDHLAGGGMLSITTGHLRDNHPRSAGRLVSVARRALRERGVADPARHIAVVSSRRLFASVLVRPEPFDDAQLERLAADSERLQFKALLLPGTPGHPVFSGLASASGEARSNLLARLGYLVDATTDDSPFFFRSFRWGSLWDADHVSPHHTSALGQIVLILLLVSLTALSIVLVLGPLAAFRRRGLGGGGKRPLGILVYFLAVGLAFMLFEISLMQRFLLLLGYPTYSLSVTLFSLLVFLGWGSFLSRRWVGRERLVLPAAVAAIAALALLYMLGLPALEERTLGAPLASRVAITVALLAPLGLVMGTFLPLGIRQAAAIHEDLVPWAWGINGCASVTATVLAVVLAMEHGFRWVWILSVAVYAVGVAALLLTTRTAPTADSPGP